jgi:hypothetical protein
MLRFKLIFFEEKTAALRKISFFHNVCIHLLKENIYVISYNNCQKANITETSVSAKDGL